MNKILRNVFFKIQCEHGSMLIIAYFVMVLLLGLGAAFVTLSTNEARVAQRQKISTTAFYIAEAGIERAIFDLSQDLTKESTPSWADRKINGITIDPGVDLSNFYTFYDMTPFNGGTYTVEFKNEDLVKGEDIWIKSTGAYSGITSTVLVSLKMLNLSPWGNAIFAGAGASGAMVNGNVNIIGSVHILGSGLADGDLAIDLGGTSELVGNNYSSCPAELKAKVPALPTVEVNGETVESIGAELRVKKGIVGLSGSSTVGEADVPGNAYKETVDDVYVSDGFGGNKAAANVYSDNGTTNSYDLGDAVTFPKLSDPDTNDPTKTYQQYYKEHALVLTNELSTLTPSSSFNYTDGTNSISMDGAGNLTITGRIYVDGNNNLTTSKSGPNSTITYSGSGSLIVTGDVQIDTDLVTSGAASFPTNILGVMTPNNISFTAAGIDAMGLFYAEKKIVVAKQTDIMGTIVSNYFDMGTNVPSVFQVPETVNYLPDGMLGKNVYWYKVVSWQKI